MSTDIPPELRYLESHEWVSEENDGGRIGISDFAQDELGDVVFVELPSEGDSIEQGATFGVVESIKAVSDLYAPVSGTITSINDALFDRPELVNDDPYGEGWMLEVAFANTDELDELLDASAYEAQIA